MDEQNVFFSENEQREQDSNLQTSPVDEVIVEADGSVWITIQDQEIQQQNMLAVWERRLAHIRSLPENSWMGGEVAGVLELVEYPELGTEEERIPLPASSDDRRGLAASWKAVEPPRSWFPSHPAAIRQRTVVRKRNEQQRLKSRRYQRAVLQDLQREVGNALRVVVAVKDHEQLVLDYKGGFVARARKMPIPPGKKTWVSTTRPKRRYTREEQIARVKREIARVRDRKLWRKFRREVRLGRQAKEDLLQTRRHWVDFVAREKVLAAKRVQDQRLEAARLRRFANLPEEEAHRVWVSTPGSDRVIVAQHRRDVARREAALARKAERRAAVIQRFLAATYPRPAMQPATERHCQLAALLRARIFFLQQQRKVKPQQIVEAAAAIRGLMDLEIRSFLQDHLHTGPIEETDQDRRWLSRNFGSYAQALAHYGTVAGYVAMMDEVAKFGEDDATQMEFRRALFQNCHRLCYQAYSPVKVYNIPIYVTVRGLYEGPNGFVPLTFKDVDLYDHLCGFGLHPDHAGDFLVLQIDSVEVRWPEEWRVPRPDDANRFERETEAWMTTYWIELGQRNCPLRRRFDDCDEVDVELYGYGDSDRDQAFITPVNIITFIHRAINRYASQDHMRNTPLQHQEALEQLMNDLHVAAHWAHFRLMFDIEPNPGPFCSDCIQKQEMIVRFMVILNLAGERASYSSVADSDSIHQAIDSFEQQVALLLAEINSHCGTSVKREQLCFAALARAQHYNLQWTELPEAGSFQKNYEQALFYETVIQELQTLVSLPSRLVSQKETLLNLFGILRDINLQPLWSAGIDTHGLVFRAANRVNEWSQQLPRQEAFADWIGINTSRINEVSSNLDGTLSGINSLIETAKQFLTQVMPNRVACVVAALINIGVAIKHRSIASLIAGVLTICAAFGLVSKITNFIVKHVYKMFDLSKSENPVAEQAVEDLFEYPAAESDDAGAHEGAGDFLYSWVASIGAFVCGYIPTKDKIQSICNLMRISNTGYSFIRNFGGIGKSLVTYVMDILYTWFGAVYGWCFGPIKMRLKDALDLVMQHPDATEYVKFFHNRERAREAAEVLRDCATAGSIEPLNLAHKAIKWSETVFSELALFGSSRGVEPFCVWLCGAKGVGKSVAMRQIATALILNDANIELPSIDRVKALDNDPVELGKLNDIYADLVYVRNSTEKHWNRYKGQPIVLYDDFGAGTPTSAVTVEGTAFGELIAIKTSNLAGLNMASVEDKAKATFSSRYIICLSNEVYPQSNCLRTPTAFQRRRDIVAWMHVDQSLMLEGVINPMKIRDDYSHVSMRIYPNVDPTYVETGGEPKQIKLGRQIELSNDYNTTTFHEFLAGVIEKANRHFRQQMGVRNNTPKYLGKHMDIFDPLKRAQILGNTTAFDMPVTEGEWDVFTDEDYAAAEKESEPGDEDTTAGDFQKKVDHLVRLAQAKKDPRDFLKKLNVKDQDQYRVWFAAYERLSVSWWKDLGFETYLLIVVGIVGILAVFVNVVFAPVTKRAQVTYGVAQEVYGAQAMQFYTQIASEDESLARVLLASLNSNATKSKDEIDREAEALGTSGQESKAYYSGDPRSARRVRARETEREDVGVQEGDDSEALGIKDTVYNVAYATHRITTPFMKVCGFNIAGRNLIVVRHAFDRMERGMQFSVSRYNESTKTLQDYFFDFNPQRWFPHPECDYGVYHLNIVWPVGRSFAHRFMDGNDVRYVYGRVGRVSPIDQGKHGGTYKVEYSSSVTPATTPIPYYERDMVTVRQMAPDYAFTYSANSTAGDCTQVIMAFEPRYEGKPLMGFHVIKQFGNSRVGVGLDLEWYHSVADDASVPYKDSRYGRQPGIQESKGLPGDPTFLPLAKWEDETTSYEVISKVVSNPMPTKTSCKPSVLYNRYGVTPYRAPAILAPRVLLRGIAKFGGIPPAFDQTFLTIAIDMLAQRFRASVPEAYLRLPVDDDVLINGKVSMEFVNRVNVKASAGYPLNLVAGKGKHNWITWNEAHDKLEYTPLGLEYLKVVKQTWEDMKQGVVPELVFNALPKDELLPIPKVEIEKTRTFMGGDMQGTLIGRLAFLPLATGLCQAGLEVGYCGGMDPLASSGSLVMFLQHMNEHRWVAGDFSGWDTKLHPMLLWGVAEVTNRVMDDGPEMARARHAYMSAIVHKKVVVQDCLMDIHIGLPSGAYVTFFGNTVAHMLSDICCWLRLTQKADFFQHVYSAYAGDDFVMSVEPAYSEIFNGETLASTQLELFGHVLTSARKNGPCEKDLPISEITFLKRSFVRYGPYWVMPLDRNVLLDIPNWIKGEPTVENYCATLNSFFTELALYPDEYEKFKCIFERLLREEHIPYVITPTALATCLQAVERPSGLGTAATSA